MRVIAIVATFAVLIFAEACSGDDIYQWTDEDGAIHFSDSIPSNKKITKTVIHDNENDTFAFTNQKDRVQVGNNITLYEDAGLIIKLEKEEDDRLAFRISTNNLQDVYPQVNKIGAVYFEVLPLKSGDEGYPKYMSLSQQRIDPGAHSFTSSTGTHGVEDYSKPYEIRTEFLRARLILRQDGRFDDPPVLFEKLIPFNKYWAPFGASKTSDPYRKWLVKKSKELEPERKARELEEIERVKNVFIIDAENGIASAQTNLAIVYQASNNHAEAMKWLLKAADQGDTTAMRMIAIAYGEGEGVKKDEAETLRWLRKAANKGDKMAIEMLKHAERNKILK
jgi:tetratricopeptide (TPR) repeat protein